MATSKEVSCRMSARARHIRNTPNMFYKYYKQYVAGDQYDPDTNPQGVVMMGAGESYLCQDLLMERMTAPDMNIVTPDMLYYGPQTGTKPFREAVSKFLTRYLKSAEPLDADRMLITSGGGAALDMLANFIADPGDCFLCPAPYYGNLIFDFGSRQQVNLVSVPLPFETFDRDPDHEQIRKIIELFVKAYKETEAKGGSVKGIILVNPHNPLGYVMKHDLMMEILRFAKRYSLHVVVDEIYCLTVFDQDTPVTSVFQLPDIPDKKRTHFVWSFSKDLNLNGIRCGVLYTWDKDLIDFGDHLLGLAMVPGIVQRKLQNMILDFDWLDIFFQTNLARVRQHYAYSTERLKEMGVPYIEAKAAYFIWADFRKWLSASTMSAEVDLLEKLVVHKVYIAPGHIQGSQQHGWFRITFVVPMTWLEQGFSNMAVLLKTISAERPQEH